MSETRADAVYRQTDQRLSRITAGEDAAVRGRLANLRRGVSRKPGEDPRTWGILFSELPEEMLGRNGEPSREEWAIHTAITLYALHQQSNDLRTQNMNKKGISLGKATSQLTVAYGGDDDSRERVARRLYQIVLAPDMPSMSYYLRSFIQLLRSENIELDYPRLAKDLYIFQLPDGAASVRLQWGQDFYSKDNQ